MTVAVKGIGFAATTRRYRTAHRHIECVRRTVHQSTARSAQEHPLTAAVGVAAAAGGGGAAAVVGHVYLSPFDAPYQVDEPPRLPKACENGRGVPTSRESVVEREKRRRDGEREGAGGNFR